jgi:spore maturation protein CgeB
MRCILFYHSLVSDWNHGNAHFLRGMVSELQERGNEVRVYEPENGWSIRNLKQERGIKPVLDFHRLFPGLHSIPYRSENLEMERLLDGADLVIVHEWNEPDLVKRLGEHRKNGGAFRLLFHDTHHRSVTKPEDMRAYDLSGFDGVLAFGAVLRDLYLERGWIQKAWVWHEAADTRVFHPFRENGKLGDVVWIGNWGDNERTAEYAEFLLEPVRDLGLSAMAYGVRYPAEALELLETAGIGYGGWLPNYEAPRVFGRYRITLHIPRRPYATLLPGIPTIRPFEALACGIPLICSPWEDSEGLFTPGKDFLVARNGREMKKWLRMLLHEPEAARALSVRGLGTILDRHTCRHRADELYRICRSIGIPGERLTGEAIPVPNENVSE